jgi:peptidoglycan/LPS O-acetylase OafA/YrhL
MTQKGGSPVLSTASLHIPSLDGLRAISFAIVFFAHSGLYVLLPIPGGFGVTVFFFLSGYLITTLLRLERQTSGAVSIRRFYLRRVLRILPPFYLVLMFAAGLTLLGLLPGGLHRPTLLAQSFHIANYWFIVNGSGEAPAGTVPYWSLAVEEHFYLVFPLLFVFMSRRLSFAGQARVLWAACAAVLAWRCLLVFGINAPTDWTYMGSDARFDSILFGCALALGANPMFDAPRGSDRVWKYVLAPVALLLLLLTFAVRAPWFRETLRYTLQGIALSPLFVVAIRFPSWLPFRPLNTRPLAFLGALSYTLYLAHQVVIMALLHRYPGMDRYAVGAAAFAIAFVIAYAMHVLVEKPCARLRRRLSGGREAARPARSPETEPVGMAIGSA